jgi:hypothetical protein
MVPDVAPASVLALIAGVFHTGLYLFIRGSAGLRLPFVALAAILGAFAGQALAARLGDPVQIGDFGVVWSSLLSWLGIILIVAASVLAPPRAATGTTRRPDRADRT